MKRIFLTLLLSSALIPCLGAQPISLVRAAELATKFMEVEKIEGKAMPELFVITALRSSPAPENIQPTTVVWKADLEETPLGGTSEEMRVAVMVDGKRYRRVLEIRFDQTVVMGKVSAEPRMRIVRPRVVPAPK